MSRFSPMRMGTTVRARFQVYGSMRQPLGGKTGPLFRRPSSRDLLAQNTPPL